MADRYVCPSTGNDGNAGTAFGSGNAWATLQHALDTAVAGEDVFLCNEATETTTAQIDIDQQNGSAGNPIRFFGRDGTDGTTQDTYTIQAVATWGGGNLIDKAASFGDNVHFHDIVFDANDLATSCWDNNDSTGHNAGLRDQFVRCRFTQAVSYGAQSNAPNERMFVDCEFDNCGVDGYFCTALNDAQADFYGCSFHDNLGYGVFADAPRFSFTHCEFYANGDDGLFAQARSAEFRAQNCTFYNNGGSGIRVNQVDEGVIINCSFAENTGYGIEVAVAGNAVDYSALYNNHFENNSSGDTNLTAGTYGYTNYSGDPVFANVTAGSEDFTPQSGSVLIGRGIMGLTIGARQAASYATAGRVVGD